MAGSSHAGAGVTGTVSPSNELDEVDATVEHAIGLDDRQPAEAIRALAPDGRASDHRGLVLRRRRPRHGGRRHRWGHRLVREPWRPAAPPVLAMLFANLTI